MAAAVADFRPKAVADGKLKKESGIARAASGADPRHPRASWGSGRASRILVGFAAETSDLEAAGRAKLQREAPGPWWSSTRSARAGTGFGSDTNDAMILSADGDDEALRTWTKTELARRHLRPARRARRRTARAASVTAAILARDMSHELPLHLGVRHRGAPRQARRPTLRRGPRRDAHAPTPTAASPARHWSPPGSSIVAGEITTDAGSTSPPSCGGPSPRSGTRTPSSGSTARRAACSPRSRTSRPTSPRGSRTPPSTARDIRRTSWTISAPATKG